MTGEGPHLPYLIFTIREPLGHAIELARRLCPKLARLGSDVWTLSQIIGMLRRFRRCHGDSSGVHDDGEILLGTWYLDGEAVGIRFAAIAKDGTKKQVVVAYKGGVIERDGKVVGTYERLEK